MPVSLLSTAAVVVIVVALGLRLGGVGRQQASDAVRSGTNLQMRQTIFE